MYVNWVYKSCRQLNGGFHAHGSIEIHYGSGVLDTPFTDSSSQIFNTEEEADTWFINKARTKIDNMYCSQH